MHINPSAFRINETSSVIAAMPLPILEREALGGAARMYDATIALMARFKPVRGRPKGPVKPQGALGCVILLLLIMVGVMVFLYFVMRSHAS
jgi:hypothetical protein